MDAEYLKKEAERIFIKSKNFRSFNRSLDKILTLHNAFFVYHPLHSGKLPKKLKKCTKLTIIIHQNGKEKIEITEITLCR